MSAAKHFERLLKSGRPVGRVQGVSRFLARVKGLQPCPLRSLILFDDGSKGFVHQIEEDHVKVLHMGRRQLSAGQTAVLQHTSLVCQVGRDFVGRVVSVTGQPLDGGRVIAADGVWPVFNTAPAISRRRLLGEQLISGITVVDSLFPIVRGQRMALLGDSKSGKSTLVAQLAANQKNSNQVVVYCLIAKRPADINDLLLRLKAEDSLKKAIVVVSTLQESLVLNWLAPYVACAMAEYLWQKADTDAIVIYDDLTAHAYVHREISLLTGLNPGRDSYPGDLFYAHSSLLERAGRLDATGRHLTAIPLVNIPGGDITTYLSTNIMSITDGQWVLDMDVFRSGVRPAVNLGLSVTRAGSLGHSRRQKALASRALKILADYRQAAEFSHFGSELALSSRRALVAGQRLLELMSQTPGDNFSLLAQQLMLDIILGLSDGDNLDTSALKLQAEDYASKIQSDEDFEAVRDNLKEAALIQAASTADRLDPTLIKAQVK